jgi:hypothetical protein
MMMLIFPIGKLIMTADENLLVILYYDYNREIRSNIDQFLKRNNLNPIIEPILHLMEIDRKHPFFSTSKNNA